MRLTSILSLLLISGFFWVPSSCFAQEKSNDHYVFYYSTVEFVETPLSPLNGSVPLSKEEAMKRNHYRFFYNDKHKLVAVSFFNGNTPKNPNHTANLFTLAHSMKFDYGDQSETISFYNKRGEPGKVLGNCSRFVYTYNDLGFRNSLYFLNDQNERLTNSWGIYEYKWEYLDDGSVIEERHDRTGNQVSIRPGFEFHRLRLYFNPSGHIALMQNIDSDGNLVENNSGASQDRLTTNSEGNFLEWNVLNNRNELEKGNGPNVAIGKQTFNKYGYEVSLEHQDEKGQIIASHYGIYKSKTEFDQFGNIRERSFFNEDGLPATHKNAGYHRLVITWDEEGNRRKTLRYFDIKGDPSAHATRGYHKVAYQYDDQEQLIKISYLSTTGELINRKDNGRAYSILSYNKDDGDVKSSHFNASNLELKSTPKSAAQSRDTLYKKIDKSVREYYQDNKFNGVVLVAKKGEILYHNAYGYASVEKNIKNTDSTAFLIGSTTKSFTAIAVLQCVEKGLLDLRTPVRDYLPELKGEAGQLTLHHLMKNSSGLPVHLNRITELEYRDINSEELIGLYNTIELSFTPGTKFDYSNLNYQLCALVVERVSGLTYIQYMKQFIFNPLEMNQSGIQRTTDHLAHRATGYVMEEGKMQHSPKNHLAYAMGGGDIYANGLDLLKWDQGLYDEKLLTQESLDLLFDGNPDEYGGYGYGFKIKMYKRNDTTHGKLVRHGGSMYGFVCNIHRYLDDQVTIIILGNIRPYPVMEITKIIEKTLLENSYFQ